jgi:hypothetical protein
VRDTSGVIRHQDGVNQIAGAVEVIDIGKTVICIEAVDIAVYIGGIRGSDPGG